MSVLTVWISMKISLSLQDNSSHAQGHITAHHSKCAIFILQPLVSLADDTFSSSLALVLSITIWFWVFYIIIFRVYLTFVQVVLIILKHATFLQLSKPSQLALIQADLDYQKANIDSKIQEHLNASSLEVSIEKFAAFVMATNISLYIFASVTILSHQSFSTIWKYHWSVLKANFWSTVYCQSLWDTAGLGRSNVKCIRKTWFLLFGAYSTFFTCHK